MAEEGVSLNPALLSDLVGDDPTTVKFVNLKNQSIVSIGQGFHLCEGMMKLDLSNNKITDVKNLKFNEELTWLNLANNSLKSLEGVEVLTKLTTLNAGSNALKRMPNVAGYTKLKALVLNNNQISKIEHLEKAFTLNALVLSNNEIRDLTGLHSLKDLAKLSLSHNKISEIPGTLQRNHQLVELRLNGNRISSIPDTLVKNPRLRIVDLGKNHITNIGDIQNLSELRHLDNLNLLGNPICESDGYRDKVIAMLPRLKILDGQKVDGLKGEGSGVVRSKRSFKGTMKKFGDDDSDENNHGEPRKPVPSRKNPLFEKNEPKAGLGEQGVDGGSPFKTRKNNQKRGDVPRERLSKGNDGGGHSASAKGNHNKGDGSFSKGFAGGKGPYKHHGDKKRSHQSMEGGDAAVQSKGKGGKKLQKREQEPNANVKKAADSTGRVMEAPSHTASVPKSGVVGVKVVKKDSKKASGEKPSFLEALGDTSVGQGGASAWD